jgi:ketosteroid isomerase-like protein
MAEELTTPDLVELWREAFEAASRRDIDAVMGFYAPDAVWDTMPMGLGVYENPTAIRSFFDDWWGAYEVFAIESVEILDLGGGVAFSVVLQRGHPVGSSGEVRLHYAAVCVWEDGKMTRTINYTDIDEARAVAERLAQERADV